MSLRLQERLEAHFGNQTIDHTPDSHSLTKVRQRARQRSTRGRIAVGLCGLAALAGLGTLVPTTSGSNSLITATEPTTTPEPIVEQIEDTSLESEFVDPPVFLNLVSDGVGGFVGVDTFGSDTIQFLRSDDGENWRLAETWVIPEGTRFETLSFADGLFIAQLEQPEPDTFEFGLLADPLLAVSPDLQTWDYIELEIERPEPLPGTPEQGVKYHIDGFVRNGDKLAMLVHTAPQFDPQTYDLFQSEICGQIDRPSGVTLLLCDGSTRDLPPGHSARTPLRPETRVFVTEDGASATALDIEIPPLDVFDFIESAYGLIAEGDGFRVLKPGDEISDVLRQEPVSDGLGATFVSAHGGSEGTTLVLAKRGEDLVPLRVTKDGATFDVTAGSFPGSADVSPTSELGVRYLGHGPAGWVLALASLDGLFVIVEQNGWTLGSAAGNPGGIARSLDGQETIAFEVNSSALPPHVHVSLFGGVRYLHPETGELLVELSASEARIPEPWAEVEDQFGIAHSIEVDGWVLSGNPVTGPLALTSPDGEVRQFGDGFAFDNDDLSDGVETDFSNRTFAQGTLYGAGGIVFYDDLGNELVTFQGYDIIDEFIAPVVDEVERFEALVAEPFAIPQVSFLYSSDGVEWIELSVADDLVGRFANSLAVGDDEIVTGLFPQELLRTPLDE